LLPGIKGLKSSSPSILIFDAIIYAPAIPKHKLSRFPILVKLVSIISVSLAFYFLEAPKVKNLKVFPF